MGWVRMEKMSMELVSVLWYLLAEQCSTPMHPVALDVPFIPPYGYYHMNDGFPRCRSCCEPL